MVDELVVRMRLEAVEGIHVTVGVFAGPDEDHLGKCGTIILRACEWEALREGKGRFQVKAITGEIPTTKDQLLPHSWHIADWLPSLQYELVEYVDAAIVKRSLRR